MANSSTFKLLEDVAADLSSDEFVFPTFLDITFQVRTALKDPCISIESLSRLVGAEPLMSAKIIKLANSAALNPYGREVADIHSAISRVGIETVRTASFAVAMEQLVLSRQMQPFIDTSRRLWEHTAKVAAVCRVLARKIAKINPDEAMFAGLVHDIGAFYLLSRAVNFPELSANDEDLNDLLVHWHEDIGHTLLSALSLPEVTLDAVRDHDTKREIMEVRTLSEVLYVGNAIAELDTNWRLPHNTPPGLEEYLHEIFDEKTLNEIIVESNDEVQSLRNALDGL